MNTSQKWLPWVSLAWIAVMVLFSFRIARLDQGPSLDGTIAVALVIVLFVIGISNIITIRCLVPPRLDLVPEERKQLVPLTSYGFVTAPAVYGLVLAGFTGEALVALPFAAMALVGLFLVWTYLREPGLG